MEEWYGLGGWVALGALVATVAAALYRGHLVRAAVLAWYPALVVFPLVGSINVLSSFQPSLVLLGVWGVISLVMARVSLGRDGGRGMSILIRYALMGGALTFALSGTAKLSQLAVAPTIAVPASLPTEGWGAVAISLAPLGAYVIATAWKRGGKG